MTLRALSVAAVLSAAAGVAAAGSTQCSPARRTERETIRRMLTRLHENGEFTGSILVARAGVAVYRAALAATPAEADALLTQPASIASLAKGFTAVAVMMLNDRGTLRYDDPVSRHLPELAAPTPAITIRHLLTHTSGIPDVGDLGIDRPDLRERDLIDAVRRHATEFARPGLGYRYSNTGYNLLAMVVERASGQGFDDFLRAAIFEPLGMSSTRPAAGARAAGTTKGDGGIVSTVDDLLKWDQALATGRLVPARTLVEALTPGRVAEGTSTYGFGWNVAEKDGDTYVWHTGNADGRRAFLGRRVKERITVIILTQGNSRRLEIADAVVDILHGRSYTPPRLSIARPLLAVIDAQGADAAMARYRQLRSTEATTYDFSEPELNSLGYSLLGRNDAAGAVRVFELNTQQFPASSNAFDSLGEALTRSGRLTEAARAYARALELDPHNLNAQSMLQKLK